MEQIRKFRIKDWKKVSKIYKQSFPKEERFSFLLLYFNCIRKNSNLFVYEINHQIQGFIYLIFYQNMIFILYLAIDKNHRKQKYGSKLLNWCQNYFSNVTFYLNIEEINPEFLDIEIRKKRLHFYLKNHFYLSEYLSIEKGGNFNILSSSKIIDIDQYKKLDKKISKWFFNKKSIIKKI